MLEQRAPEGARRDLVLGRDRLGNTQQEAQATNAKPNKSHTRHKKHLTQKQKVCFVDLFCVLFSDLITLRIALSSFALL